MIKVLRKGVLIKDSKKQVAPIEPSYIDKRIEAYGEIGEQLDMLYKDLVNGTNNWVKHIEQVKTNIKKG